MAAENNSFNVLRHSLVPEHHLLTEEEAEAILKQLKITRDQLPKIKTTDPAIIVLETIHGPIAEGSVIKVVRKSETAQEFTAYRLVTKG
ncbi:MAG: DNA-directed RNA polymerase subunit H [Candidatus Methanomethylophilus sp.]|nr:DNA-directed RNA polymerase subunit H [Methanomethylophilus sp.]MDD3233301.1 DNA-directed RNA polymerase subunit H [Methanomethylophilus sp.]MDD4221903.1 DNA-directed RNA polymerase subunit H [Methanomethylophilus sp.]MDD4668239.1 DNA-directed RNA polymerase subunit H [Methanomethylophilus sp.]